jgi:branched-chain amino acid aminotransferase
MAGVLIAFFACASDTLPPMRKVWLDGEVLPKDDARISVFDHGLLYGDGVFEGIRIYGGRVFKLRSHLQRLFSSAERIRLTPPMSMEEMECAVRQAVAANDLADGYIRLIVTRGPGTLGLNPFNCPRPSAIIIVDEIRLYAKELYERGMSVIVARRPRIPTACLDPSIKSLNYLNNVLAKIEAVDAGVPEAIMLNTDGHVAECTGDNIFYVKGGRIVTPSKEAGFLHGITRRFVIEALAPSLAIPVEERLLRLDELLTAEEVFLTGTAAEIIGVTRIDDHRIADEVGPVTKALMAEFRRRVMDNAPED